MLCRRLLRSRLYSTTIGLLLLLTLLYHSNLKERNFHFTLENAPYIHLENGRCVLGSNGKWDCPDIRRIGKTKLRQTHIVTTRMLLVFDALAKKHDIRYWITRGTLLGAARHQGHIPWDTDLDIEMPIDDYIKFVRKAAGELPSGLTLQHHKTESQYLHVLNKTYHNEQEKQLISEAVRAPWNPRLRDDNSCFGNCLKEGCTWHDGLMIDIFPVSLSGQDIYSIQFSFKIVRFLWKIAGYQIDFQAFPLKELQFEGFQMPVLYDWMTYLTVYYGSNYKELPSSSMRHPPGNSVPEPLYSCSQLKRLINVK